MINLPSPRFILIHAHDSTLDANDLDNRAHAFGPFDSYEALVHFDREGSDDNCYRFAVPLVGPETLDVTLTARGLREGARAGAMPLPPRTTERTMTPLTNLIQRAFEEIERQQKAERKRAKKEAKRAKRLADLREIDEMNLEGPTE